MFTKTPRLLIECFAYILQIPYRDDDATITKILNGAEQMKLYKWRDSGGLELLSARGIFDHPNIMKRYTKRPPAKSVIITLGEY